MADIIPPGFAEITVPMRHALIPRSAAVVFGVTDNSGVNTPEDQADQIQGMFMTAMGGRVDSQVVIGPTEIRIGQDGGEEISSSGTVTAPGGRSGDSVNPAVALLYRKGTARGGRRGRGRLYLPWALYDADVDEAGVILPAVLTSMNALAATFLGQLTANGNDMVLLHSVGQTPPGDPDPVTSLTCDPRIGIQRRRLARN